MALRLRSGDLGLIALRLLVRMMLGIARRLEVAPDFRLAVLEDALNPGKGEL